MTISPVPTYAAPGPGAWQLDADHQSTQRGRLTQAILEPGYRGGSQACFGRYGLPLDRLERGKAN